MTDKEMTDKEMEDKEMTDKEMTDKETARINEEIDCLIRFGFLWLESLKLDLLSLV